MSEASVSTANLFSLEGKTVLATGGTGGLGSQMCLALAEMGADIISIHVANDPAEGDLKELVEKTGRRYNGFEADVGDSAALRKTIQSIWEAGHSADILLNCAGINRRGAIEEMTDDMIDSIFSVNLKGAYVAAQEFGMRLRSLGRPGKIINIGSFTSFVAMTNVSAYAATKGGILQLTKAFSNEWAQYGIQVNCICPGYIMTPMAQTLIAKYPDMEKYIIDRTPAGRWGKPTDFRGAVVFLASPASDFITGTSIVVDGGMQFR